jgi:hypothetical protein
VNDPDNMPRWARAWGVSILVLTLLAMGALIVALVFLASYLRENTGC